VVNSEIALTFGAEFSIIVNEIGVHGSWFIVFGDTQSAIRYTGDSRKVIRSSDYQEVEIRMPGHQEWNIEGNIFPAFSAIPAVKYGR